MNFLLPNATALVVQPCCPPPSSRMVFFEPLMQELTPEQPVSHALSFGAWPLQMERIYPVGQCRQSLSLATALT